MSPTRGALTATEIDVVTTTGSNGAPASGYVQFSDGKYFGFSIKPDTGSLTFSTFEARPTRHGLRLPKREAAVRSAFETGQGVERVVIKVSLGDARA